MTLDFVRLLFTYLLRTLLLMLFVANWARFFNALAETIFKLGSFRFCEEFRHRKLLKFNVTGDGLACFMSWVAWSTDSCLRKILLLSLDGLSLSIDFCLRRIFFALLGWNCCRMVDILLLSFVVWMRRNQFLLWFSCLYFHDFYCNPITLSFDVDLMSFM